MSFNNGFYCTNCGPVEKAKKKTINKKQCDVCMVCSEIVEKWTRPLKERAGRCSNCSGASFTLAIVKSRLLRCCKQCKMVIDPDTKEIIREGER